MTLKHIQQTTIYLKIIANHYTHKTNDQIYIYKFGVVNGFSRHTPPLEGN